MKTLRSKQHTKHTLEMSMANPLVCRRNFLVGATACAIQPMTAVASEVSAANTMWMKMRKPCRVLPEWLCRNNCNIRPQCLENTSNVVSCANANAILEERPQIVRQIASWNDGSLQCWCEFHASDAQAVDDIENLFGERSIVDHINIENFERDLKRIKTRSLPTLRVACASGNNLNEAAQIAFSRAGANRLRNVGQVQWAGVATVSIADKRYFLETLKSMHCWMIDNLPQDAFVDVQMLVDRELQGDDKRVSVALAP